MIATVCYCTFWQLSLASGKTIAGGTLGKSCSIIGIPWNHMEPLYFWGEIRGRNHGFHWFPGFRRRCFPFQSVAGAGQHQGHTELGGVLAGSGMEMFWGPKDFDFDKKTPEIS